MKQSMSSLFSSSNKKYLGSRSKRLPMMLAISVLLCCVALAFASMKASWRVKSNASERASSASSPLAQGTPRANNRLHGRLSLQPEADKQRRRLGQRFLAPGREVSTLVGMLTLGTDRQMARIVRSQDDDDERLTIALGGGAPAITWSGVEGAKSNGVSATGSLRSLIERLALDSPDQFILAQLRGASYLTVARDVRLAEAGGANNYTGPRWDLVRVAEPARLTQNRPQSLWRLYHINSSTALIDKVVSQEQGQMITAEFSNWVAQNGETFPTQIVWKLNNQTVMELSLTNVTHNPKQ
jgi:hypothetical protein